jgi:tripartite-type tricarboxylate transporter receptor subunit TctC
MLKHCRNLGFAAMFATVAVLVALTGHDAWSQARTVKIVVPFPPGGSADILARLLGEQVGKAQGLTVLTENRPGAGASIAYEADPAAMAGTMRVIVPAMAARTLRAARIGRARA